MNFGSCKYSNFHGNRTRAKRFGNLISHHGGFISFENVCKKLMGIGNHSNCFNWVIFMKNWLFITPFTTWLLRVKQITRVHGKVREFGNLWLLWPCISDRFYLEAVDSTTTSKSWNKTVVYWNSHLTYKWQPGIKDVNKRTSVRHVPQKRTRWTCLYSP